jgi:lysophospholipase L1-like esterase
MLRLIIVLCATLVSGSALAQTTAPIAGMGSTGTITVQAPSSDTIAESTDRVCPPPLAMPAGFNEKTLTPGMTLNLTALNAEDIEQGLAFQKEAAARQAVDWANVCHYAAANAAALSNEERPLAVLMGDSITANWIIADPALFSAKLLDRGIGGQTTSQMLLRMYPDVIALRPRVVHILAGVNDIFGNTGQVPDQLIVANIRAMIELAHANGIQVVLGAMTPTTGFSLMPGFNPAERIKRVNALFQQIAAEKQVLFIDYHTAVADADGGFRAGLANDLLHPNRDGYRIMRPMMLSAITKYGKL